MATATQDKKESARDEARRKRADAAGQARKQKIADGDLIETKTHEFEVTEKAPASAKQMAKICEKYRKSQKPLIFNEVATACGAKYPEDLIVAMYALENEGHVKRFAARQKEGDSRRPRVAFLWVGEK